MMLFPKPISLELTYTGYRKDGSFSVDKRTVDKRNPDKRTGAPEASQSFR
jgi:hypothetical protein